MCSWGSLSGLWEEAWTLSIGLSATILEVILTTDTGKGEVYPVKPV